MAGWVQELIGTQRTIEGAEAMRTLGAEIAHLLEAGDILLLHGDLGAGKTTLSQGIARGLGVSQTVTSPTFTLAAEYPVAPPVRDIERLVHLDLYRLTDVNELDSFGFEEYLAPERAVTLIEWPERAGEWFPNHALIIEIETDGIDRRRVRFRSFGG